MNMTKPLRTMLLALTLVALYTGKAAAVDGVAVIAHPSISKIDAPTVARVFLGREVYVGGVAVTAVNAATGNALRSRFLQVFVKKDEDSYTGHWIVSRYSGLGAPPKELASSADVVKFVQSTPGAIGYIDEADIKPGMNVLIK